MINDNYSCSDQHLCPTPFFHLLISFRQAQPVGRRQYINAVVGILWKSRCPLITRVDHRGSSDAGFFAIGLYTPESERLCHLTEVRGIPAADSRRLLSRDEEEPLAHGQQARDAFQLADALTFEESEKLAKVLLEPFVGVGPRRYLDLFSLRLGSGWPLDRKVGKMVAPWRREGARPRVQMRPVAYLEKERAVQRLVDSLLQQGNQGEGTA